MRSWAGAWHGPGDLDGESARRLDLAYREAQAALEATRAGPVEDGTETMRRDDKNQHHG